MNQQGRKRSLHPTQIVVIAFGAVAIIGTLLLLLPISTAPGNQTSIVAAFFTAVSAVCITGLTVVDTATHWSGFGQFVIMLLIQIGGLGIVSFATLLGLLISGRISLSDRLNTLSEAKIVGADSVPKLLSRILLVYFGFELILATYLSLRLHFSYGEDLLSAIWHGTFHAISAFNNGGFSLYSESMVLFNQDMFFIAPVMLAVVVGGLGFPVLIELHERFWRLRLQPGGRAKRFSLHTRLTLWMTGSLILLGALFIGAIEWNNPGTLGGLGTWDKIVNTLFSAIMPRSGGFNSIDISLMDPATWLGIDL